MPECFVLWQRERIVLIFFEEESRYGYVCSCCDANVFCRCCRQQIGRAAAVACAQIVAAVIFLILVSEMSSWNDKYNSEVIPTTIIIVVRRVRRTFQNDSAKRSHTYRPWTVCSEDVTHCTIINIVFNKGTCEMTRLPWTDVINARRYTLDDDGRARSRVWNSKTDEKLSAMDPDSCSSTVPVGWWTKLASFPVARKSYPNR